MSIYYEWVIETVDAHDDIIDVSHAKTFDKAVKDAEQTVLEKGQRIEIGLVRNRHHDFDGNLEDRQWAYLTRGTHGELPSTFDGGAKVPKRFEHEVSCAGRWTP